MTTRKAAPEGQTSFQSIRDWVADLSADAVAQAVSAASDIALVLDRDGVIRDVAVGADDLAATGLAGLRGQKWVDTVAKDSRDKVIEMLAAANAGTAEKPAKAAGKTKSNDARQTNAAQNTPPLNGARTPVRWREINHQTADGGVAPIRYCAVSAGQSGKIVALGRDLRSAAALQQRLLQVEQAMERDYARLRAAENRYRLLFHAVTEAVLVVDAGSRRIIEANPAAGALFNTDHASLIGKPMSWFVGLESQEAAAAALIGQSQSGQGARAEPIVIQLADGRGPARMSVALFRQDRVTHFLVRLSAMAASARASRSDGAVGDVVERMPDAFVVTGEDLTILHANTAFLDLAQAPNLESARGAALSKFLGRSGVDLNVLVQTVREHGWARNFATVLRTPFDGQEAVDVSAAIALHGAGQVIGFSLRASQRAVSVDTHRDLDSLPRSVEQLTDLIGRVPLKEIVRETTDIIERLCIEAALKLTSDNRASAAELLGLSRQSLYSKLHRFGIAGSGDGEPELS